MLVDDLIERLKLLPEKSIIDVDKTTREELLRLESENKVYLDEHYFQAVMAVKGIKFTLFVIAVAVCIGLSVYLWHIFVR